VRPPVSRDGLSGARATSGDVPELERRHRHDNRQQQTAAPSPPTPQAETPEPLEPHRRPDPATPAAAPTTRLSPALPAFPSRRLDCSPPRLTHLIAAYLICLTPIPLPPPRLRPLQLPAWAGPSRFTWQVEEGGSGAKRRTPLSRKPRRVAKETPSGGAAACCAHGGNPLNETDGAKHMEGNRPGNHRRHDRADLGSCFPRAICPAPAFTPSESQA
jgi:hypothetical protein